MKVVKKLLIALVILIAIPFVVAIFVNGEYAVVREVTINQPKNDVFNYLKNLKNQDNFSVWNNIDPNMKKDFKGTDGEVGAVAIWDSQNDSVGAGEQEIIKITEGERIDFELRFLRPFEATDYAYFETADGEDGSTVVKWGFDGKMDYPMNIMMLFMDMEEMLAPSLETGLANLKDVMNNMPAKSKVEISEVEVDALPILYIAQASTLNPDSIAFKLGDAFGEISAFIAENNLTMAGAPMSITTKFSMEEGMWEFNASLTVAEPIEELELTGRIQRGMTHQGKAVKAIHVGSYASSPSTYYAIEDYIKANGLEEAGGPWEIYVDDPSQVEESELKTEIYFPVK